MLLRLGLRARTLQALLMIATLALPARAFALADFLQPAPLSDFIKRQIAKQNIGANIKLYNLALLNGVTTSARYRYAAEPSYIDSFYTRYDSYSIENRVEPSAWVTHLGGPFSFGFAEGSDLIFVRQFKTQKEAALAAPYPPKRMPISATKALNELEIGDFVSFQSHLVLSVSLGGSVPIFGPFAINGATHALISGSFLVHLYKVDPDHIRVKLIALHEGDAGASGGLGLAQQIKIIAMKVANAHIERAWDVDLGSKSKDFDLSDLYMIDYVLNLRDPRVAAAYNNLMQKKALLKSAEMLYPLKEQTVLEKSLVTDFSEFEELYHQDKDKPEKDRAVNRLFKGSTITSTLKNNLSFDISFLRFDYQTFFARNRITTFDSDEKQVHYLFDTFSTYKDRNMPFHLMDRTESINSNLLFTATPGFDPVRFVGLFMNREIRAQSLSQSGLEDIRTHLRNTLPARIFQQIPLNTWDLSKNEAVNVFFRHEIYFPPDAVKAIPFSDTAGLKRKYQDFLKSLPKVNAYPMYQGQITASGSEEGSNTNDYYTTVTERYDQDMDFICSQISLAFDPKADVSIRYNSFLKLKNNDLFQETGAGFLIYLLPQDRLNELIGYSLTLTGQDHEKISFLFGAPTEDDLYRSMLYIQNLLNSRTVDLRLLQDGKESGTSGAGAQTP